MSNIRSTNIGWRLTAAVAVAAGVTVIWALACAWIGSLAETFVFASDRVDESIAIAADGTPVVTTRARSSGAYADVGRRTLDGAAWPSDYETWLNGAYLQSRPQPPGLVDIPLGWYRNRIGAGSDGKHPPAIWYIVCDPEHDRRLHFAAYDPLSKSPIGFLGRDGFRATPPSAEQRFRLPTDTAAGINRFVATRGYFDYWSLYVHHHMPDRGRLAPWLVYMLEADQLWEVDLRKRSVRPVLALSGGMSVSTISVLEEQLAESPAGPQEGNAKHDRNAASFRMASLAAQEVVVEVPLSIATSPIKFETALAIHTDDQISIFDPPTGRRWDFRLPDDLSDRSIRVHWPAIDQLMINYSDGYWADGSILELLWTKSDGTVDRRERIELLGWTPPSPRRTAWSLCAAGPIPIGWFVGTTLVAPLKEVQRHQAASYSAGLQHVFAYAWPPLIVVLGVGVAAAAVVRRWQRRYLRPATGAWCAFAFLLGAPGLIAYWLEHRRPKLEACGECGQVVPRDRDACAVCEVPFPAPPAVGTEIFA